MNFWDNVNKNTDDIKKDGNIKKPNGVTFGNINQNRDIRPREIGQLRSVNLKKEEGGLENLTPTGTPSNISLTRSGIEQQELPRTWGNIDDKSYLDTLPEKVIQNRKSFFFKFFIFAAIVFVLALGYAGVRYYLNSNRVSAEDIVITDTISDYAESGKMYPLNISISNKNSVPIESVVLRLNYEKGVNPNGEVDIQKTEFNIGNILAEGNYASTTEVMFFGREADVRKVKMDLNYKVQGSNANFLKSSEKQVKISAPLVTLSMDAPKKVIADHEYAINISVKNVGQDNFLPSMVNVVVPDGFSVRRDGSDNPTIFKINELKKGDSRKFTLLGKFPNSVGQVKNFRVYVSTQKEGGIGPSFAESQAEVNIVAEPVQIVTNFKSDYAPVKSLLIGKNNEIEMIVSNSDSYALDEVSIKINSNKNEVFSFDSSTTPTLLRLNPSEKSTVLFYPKDLSKGVNVFKYEIFGKVKGTFNTILLRQGELRIEAI